MSGSPMNCLLISVAHRRRAAVCALGAFDHWSALPIAHPELIADGPGHTFHFFYQHFFISTF
jgi:hypothetical protein